MLAPNSTASRNGIGSAPSCCDVATAIGVPITAAALFDTMFVNMAMVSKKRLRITGAGRPLAACTNAPARYSAIPVATRALPIPRLATMSMMTGTGTALRASRQVRQLRASIKPTPISALMAIGSNPIAAVTTTIRSTARALPAWPVGGKAIDPSRTIRRLASRNSPMAARVPCNSKTSPALRRRPTTPRRTTFRGQWLRCTAIGTTCVPVATSASESDRR